MSEKEFREETHDNARVIDKKIQYGENEYACFACGERIKIDTNVCPYCDTVLKKNETILK